MRDDWKEGLPIYRQLESRVSALILDGTYAEGDAVPSVRRVSSDFNINHLTVAKAYQELVDSGLLEKKRGLGMFVIPGAKEALMKNEKDKFLNTELPEFLDRLTQLDISKQEVIDQIQSTITEEH